MDESSSSNYKKWMKKCLKKEFGHIIERNFEKEDETKIVEKIIHSKKLPTFINFMKTEIADNEESAKFSYKAMESPSETPLSFVSDSTIDDWNCLKDNDNDDQYINVIDQINADKPIHVRLAGYEILLKSDLTNVCTSPQWEVLQGMLHNSLTDDSRPVFEASLQIHAKLLNCCQSIDIFQNLLNAFNTQYHLKTLPTLISGINFKLLLHEKLFKIMHLMIQHQEEMLKRIRNVDKFVEDTIERFIIFLSTHDSNNSTQVKPLNVLNIISVLEPQAAWMKKWSHNYSTRKTFINALAKSPTLLQTVIKDVENTLERSLSTSTLSIFVYDEPNEVCISGDTVEAITHLHCLNFLSQLCIHDIGRKLISDCPLPNPFSISDFIKKLVLSLDKLISFGPPNGIYQVSSTVLERMLNQSVTLYDDNFYETVFHDLLHSPEDDIKIWPHTKNILNQMLNTPDGLDFAVAENREDSTVTESRCLANVIIGHAIKLLKQPFSLINIEYIEDVFEIMNKLFDSCKTYEIIENIVQKFLSTVAQVYSKMDKYYVENENKAQRFNNIMKTVLLKIASIPFGLQALSCEQFVLEEIIRSCMAPLRAPWTRTEIVYFVTTVAFFDLACEVLAELAPHVLSTLLCETCKHSEDEKSFFDPWINENIEKFIHIFAFFSLNFKCFDAFTNNNSELIDKEECPDNLFELLRCSVNFDSQYHYLGLLLLKTTIWNLDIYIYLLNLINLQDELLNCQEKCRLSDPQESEEEFDDESPTDYIIDECSLMRHIILSNSYYIKHKYKESTLDLEEIRLFSTLAQHEEINTNVISKSDSESELDTFLKDVRPGLRDNDWVSEVIQVYEDSKNFMKIQVLRNLLNEMQKAIPTTEWLDHFKWDENINHDIDYWFPEEIHGIDLTLRYGQLNELIPNSEETKDNFKRFLQISHSFIKYERSGRFEGFDWFSSTVFIICQGDIDKSKDFITRLIRFPSAMFMWPCLGKVIDKSLKEENKTRFTFIQLLDFIVDCELPYLSYVLKNSSGISWWMLTNAMISQCFWGILPWHEILNFFSICIVYPPDYMIYYFVAMFHHCKNSLIRDAMTGKLWPEHMVVDDYNSHNYISFMGTLAKRYRDKVFSTLSERKLSQMDQG